MRRKIYKPIPRVSVPLKEYVELVVAQENLKMFMENNGLIPGSTSGLSH